MVKTSGTISEIAISSVITREFSAIRRLDSQSQEELIKSGTKTLNVTKKFAPL